MGSTSDLSHCEKIKKACGNFGIPCELRVTSAHKGPDETLRIKAEYEGKYHITRVFQDLPKNFMFGLIMLKKNLPQFQSSLYLLPKSVRCSRHLECLREKELKMQHVYT